MPPKTADRDLLVEYTNTPARRHAFLCKCAKCFDTPLGVFWLLVQQFKTDPKRTQAQLINDWFIEGNIPEILQGGFLDTVNIGQVEGREAFEPAKKYLRATTFTSGGLFGALQTKINGTTPPANLFDKIFQKLTQPLFTLRNQLAKDYNPDVACQLEGTVVTQEKIQILSRHLTLAGFNPDKAGIY